MRIRINHILNGVFCLLLTGITLTAEGQVMDESLNAEMVLVPAGEFTMGSNKEDNISMWREANALNPYGFREQLYLNERPGHKVTLPAFLMDKYEVTNAQYRDFAIATQHKVPDSWPRNGYNFSNDHLAALPLEELRRVATDNFKLDMDVPNMSQQALLDAMEKIQAQRDKFPVTFVTWFDANDYCAWAGKRLPTEAEWEKAARGPKGFEYPWGNNWDPKKLNTMSEDPDQPYTAVGSYPGDVSPYGVYDMAGNVAEWVQDWYDAYPGSTAVNKTFGKIHRVIRGGMASSGHYDSISVVFRAARRMHLAPNAALVDLGFRCVKDIQ
jgi:formylglycine-generating enzyme required for sulfatase activity